MKTVTAGQTVLVILAALLTAAGVSAAVTGTRPAHIVNGLTLASSTLPAWNISEICASDSAGGQCRLLEAQAYRTISGGWDELPDSFRDACIGSVKSPYDKSYRLLSQCLEAQVLKGRDKHLIDTAQTAGKLVQNTKAESGGPARGSDNSFAILPTKSTGDLIKAREAWGKGGAAKKVEAPLAAGAVAPLPATNFALPKGFSGEPTVHPLTSSPVVTMPTVAQDQIDSALSKLLADRAGWGKASPNAMAPADGGGAGALAVLPTTSVADLVSAREAWGKGSAAKKVDAPLAAGAYSPLPNTKFAVPKGFDGEPTVHALIATPAAQMTPVPQADIDSAMSKLLATRAGWGTAPGNGGGGELAVLPTTTVADLVSAREAWGMGGPAKVVAAPLAAGAVSPLPSGDFKLPKGFDGTPTLHALKATPAPELIAIPQGQLAGALKSLLAEREGWLKAPSTSSAASGDGGDYAVLPTNSVADLVAAREAWGTGGGAKKVAAPLAKGAVSPLPESKSVLPKGFSGEPTVHPLNATPAAQLTSIPQGQISDAMSKLLAERAGWGTKPSSGGGSGGYAVLPTTSVADLFAAREEWGTGGAAKKVAAPLAKGAVSPLPSNNFKLAKGFSGEPTVHPLQATPAAQPSAIPQGQISDALSKLLAEREGWGKEPSKGGASATAPRSAEAADCEAKLRGAASAGVILFASGSANLSGKSNATLDKLADVAKGCAKGKIRVEGHTDSTGRASFNKTLSERRAQAVADYLTRAGVSKDRVEAAGFGQDQPVASNNTSDGRAKNRRIEFTVSD